MSTNGVYGLMQNWLNSHGNAVNEYTSTMNRINNELNEIFQLAQGELTKQQAEELTQKYNDLRIEYLEAELNYLKGQKEAGYSFDFMEGDYDISNAQTFVPAYVEQTAKLAQGDMNAWETDGEEGISLEEYTAAQLGSPNTSNLNDEQYESAKAYSTATFNAIDIDGDGILEKNELQGFYAAVDNADGSVDGKISSSSLGIDYTSDKFKTNIQEFQKYLT